MKTLQKPRAVIFDWDDTVVSNWFAATEALNAAFKHMGMQPWTEDEARRNAGPSARDLFRSLFGDRWQEADRVFYDTFNRLVFNNVRVYDHIEDILKALHGEGVYLAVVSNKRGPMLREEATHVGFDKYFGRVVGAGDAEADKPDPAPVLLALRDSGILPGPDVWFIGDSQTDMMCAVRSGCAPILIETKPPPEDILMESPPAGRFKNHLNLMEFIRGHFS